VLVIGGGFDALTLKLYGLFPDIHFFEIDRGETRTIKLEAIKTLNIQSKNLHFIECDLGHDKLIDKLLETHCFDPLKNTIAIAEGVLIYLSEKEVSDLFKTLKDDILSKESIFITSFHETCEETVKEGRGAFQWYADMAKKVGEGYRFFKRLDHIPEFVYQNGFSLESKLTNFSLQQQCGDKKVTRKTEKLVPENYVILKIGALHSIQKIDEVPDVQLVKNANELVQLRKDVVRKYSFSQEKKEEMECKLPVFQNHFSNRALFGAGLGVTTAFYMGGGPLKLLFRAGVGGMIGAATILGAEKMKEYYESRKSVAKDSVEIKDNVRERRSF
jgi:hypothetical protein